MVSHHSRGWYGRLSSDQRADEIRASQGRRARRKEREAEAVLVSERTIADIVAAVLARPRRRSDAP